MKYRLLKLFLFFSAIIWGVSAFGLFLSWETIVHLLKGMGAEAIPADNMLQYWFRMAAGAFTGVGIFFLILALSPRKFANVLGLAAVLVVFEGIVIAVNGAILGLTPFPFLGDVLACLFVGGGIWFLRKEAYAMPNPN